MHMEHAVFMKQLGPIFVQKNASEISCNSEGMSYHVQPPTSGHMLCDHSSKINVNHYPDGMRKHR